MTTWKPYEGKQYRGTQPRGWRDKLDKFWKSTIWQRIAQDRHEWICLTGKAMRLHSQETWTAKS